MCKSYNVAVRPDGCIQFIYADELFDFLDSGESTIKRVSFVEPGDGGWYANMEPINGPLLGPYKLRGKALEAEVRWLQSNLNL